MFWALGGIQGVGKMIRFAKKQKQSSGTGSVRNAYADALFFHDLGHQI